jgi:hypothetical protein
MGGVTRDGQSEGEMVGLEEHDLVTFDNLFNLEGGALNDKDFDAIFSSFGPLADEADMHI